MNHTPPPLPKSLACQRDPDRWFDRRRRRDALTECLQCPARQRCAEEALKCQACCGMWAGVWIDGQHSQALPYLHDIATDDTAATGQRPQQPGVDAVARPNPTGLAPLVRPSGSFRSRSILAAVLVRSSGNCEVFAAGCQYAFDRALTRRPNHADPKNSCVAEVFAACAVCAETVAALDPVLATQLGYHIESGRDPASAPFYWRQSRWVLLDRDGWLTEVDAVKARSA